MHRDAQNSFFRENKAWKTQFQGLRRSQSCQRFIRKVADGYLSEHCATYGRRSSVSGRWSNVGSAPRFPSNGATRHFNLCNHFLYITLSFNLLNQIFFIINSFHFQRDTTYDLISWPLWKKMRDEVQVPPQDFHVAELLTPTWAAWKRYLWRHYTLEFRVKWIKWIKWNTSWGIEIVLEKKTQRWRDLAR